MIGFFDEQHFHFGKRAVRVVLYSLQLVDVDVVILDWQLALLLRLGPPRLYLFVGRQVLLRGQLDCLTCYLALLVLLLLQLGPLRLDF